MQTARSREHGNIKIAPLSRTAINYLFIRRTVGSARSQCIEKTSRWFVPRRVKWNETSVGLQRAKHRRTWIEIEEKISYAEITSAEKTLHSRNPRNNHPRSGYDSFATAIVPLSIFRPREIKRKPVLFCILAYCKNTIKVARYLTFFTEYSHYYEKLAKN